MVRAFVGVCDALCEATFAVLMAQLQDVRARAPPADSSVWLTLWLPLGMWPTVSRGGGGAALDMLPEDPLLAILEALATHAEKVYTPSSPISTPPRGSYPSTTQPPSTPPLENLPPAPDTPPAALPSRPQD